MDTDGICVYNISATGKYANAISDLVIGGFDKTKKATLLINLDLKGKTTYSLNGIKPVYSDGSSVQAGEAHTWENATMFLSLACVVVLYRKGKQKQAEK